MAMEMESVKESAANEGDAKREHPKLTNVDILISKWHITAKTIDGASRRLFPAIFLVFNIIYWLTYAVFY